MDYFESLLELLKIERNEDRRQYEQLAESASIAERRENGLTWYPIVVRDTEMSRGDYLTVEAERTSHQDIAPQFRSGSAVVLFSNHDPKNNREEGVVSWQNGNTIKVTLRTDELPEWAKDGKLGIDLLFDDNSYEEMQNALKKAKALAGDDKESRLIKVLTGERSPVFHSPGNGLSKAPAEISEDRGINKLRPSSLNTSQQAAVEKIVAAADLAIVHGPPGTGKTTTLVQAIKALVNQDRQPVLVVAPSNTAVDLLSEKLSDEGLNVLRVGNPARVSERLLSLTLYHKMSNHGQVKEIKKLKKRANEFRDMAQKYKRQFGKAEREQRHALFAEARNIMKEVERTEEYILKDLVNKAQVITATLVGANHYTVRDLNYSAVVIDEAGQALEPASWIPILKGKKLVLAGDHCQLPPTIKSDEAARKGLSLTLLEKCVSLHPEAVVLLEEQYRMNKMIMGYSSSTFYEGRLKAHPAVADRLIAEEEGPFSFIDTAGCGFDEKKEGAGISNPEEAAFLVKHLIRLVTEMEKHYPVKEDFPSIAVISPYRHQVEILRELVEGSAVLRGYREKIAVNTIDSFQGQERDIVYIGMTRSNQITERSEGSRKGTTEFLAGGEDDGQRDGARNEALAKFRIGFLSEVRRMNVALTRARKKLVVIGDSSTLSQFPFYAGLIAYAEQHDAYQSAWEYMD